MIVLLFGGVSLAVHAAAPPPEPLKQLWADLATGDPVKAEQVMARLVARQAETVNFLRKHLHPITVDPPRVARWLAELDSDIHATREQASRALESLSEVVEPQLRQALAAKPSLEARRRIERLLKQVRGERLSPSRQRRRVMSAIEVLERIGSPAARQLLAALARGAPTAALTIDAKAALERLVPE
jgi:hypothetical protein